MQRAEIIHFLYRAKKKTVKNKCFKICGRNIGKKKVLSIPSCLFGRGLNSKASAESKWERERTQSKIFAGKFCNRSCDCNLTSLLFMITIHE